MLRILGSTRWKLFCKYPRKEWSHTGTGRAGNDRWLGCKSRKLNRIKYHWKICARGQKGSRRSVRGFLRSRQLVHHKHMLQTTEQTTVYMDIARWPIWKSNRLCDWMQEMEKLCSLCQNKTRNRSGYWSWTANIKHQGTAEEEQWKNHSAKIACK